MAKEKNIDNELFNPEEMQSPFREYQGGGCRRT